MSAEYPTLIDFEWFALDSLGCLARFTSAGTGPVPWVALSQAEQLEAVSEMLTSLEPTTDARLAPYFGDRSEDVFWSERGFYLYDWNDRHAHGLQDAFYMRVAQPSHALKAGELPSSAIRLLSAAPTFNREFSSTENLRPASELKWIYADSTRG